MSNDPNNPTGQGPSPDPNQPRKDSGKDSGTFSQEVRHHPVSARVPERVRNGVMSTGVLVLDGPNEFVIDFMQGLARPFQVAARVVLPPQVMEQFVHALRDNIAKYENRFGLIPPLPKPPTDRRPTLQEIYDEFKLPDEQLSGTYANAMMVGHSPSEFFFDFITNFYPTSAVSCRVFLSVSQVPRVLEAASMAFGRFQQRMQQMRQQMLQQMQGQPPQQPTPQNPASQLPQNPPPNEPPNEPPKAEEPPPQNA